jgi:hypothetical protein
MKDINGKLIHEGDTVLFTFFYYAECEIEETKRGKILYKKGKPYFYDGQEYYLHELMFDSESDIEIINRNERD